MNRDYAQKGKFFPDSDGVREEAEKLTGTDLSSFFAQYVAGTAELPYEELFAGVGVVLEMQNRVVADGGFAAARNFAGPLVIEDVHGEQARSAGLQEGMEIQAVDGQAPGRNLDQQFANSTPGAKVRITVSSRGMRKDVQLTLGERNVKTYVLRESPQATAEQLARRHAWLTSEDEAPAYSR
jgi:predicted metalloprotease with PDZ domain